MIGIECNDNQAEIGQEESVAVFLHCGHSFSFSL